MTNHRMDAGSGPPSRWASRGPAMIAGAFLVSGTVHLVRPQVYLPLIPRFLPRPRDIVYVSGVAELVCAAGLALNASWAGTASAAVLVGVWPGNLQLAIDVTRAAGSRPMDRAKVAAVWARMPLQLPMIAAAIAARRRRPEPV